MYRGNGIEEHVPEDSVEPSGHDQKIEVSEDADPVTVLEFHKEATKRFEPFIRESAVRAEVNERFANGEQGIGIASDGSVSEDDADSIRATRNHIRNLVLAWSARIMEDRPTIKAWPSDSSGGDDASAKVANKLIAHQHQIQDIDAMLMRGAKLAQCHSCIGIRVHWDRDGGPEALIPAEGEDGLPVYDEMGEPVMEPQRLGEVRWDLVTIFNFITDGSERIEDSPYVAFCKYIDKHEAAALLRDAGVDEKPNEKEVPTTWEAKRKGVETWEVWHRPTRRIPKGFFAIVCDGHVVEYRDYPYRHGELPVAIWKVGDRTDHPHGTTHVDDAMPIQRQINHRLTVALEISRRVGEGVKLIAPSKVIQEWDQGSEKIPCDDVAMANSIRFIEPPLKVVSEMYGLAQLDEEALFKVFGLNEILTGAQNVTGATSGRAIAYLKELDSQKLAEAARNLGEVLMRCWRQTLRLYQQYVHHERIVRIAGPENEMQAISFRGADLAGVDVRLEPMSGVERWRAAKSGHAEEMMQGGFMEPQRAGALMVSGLDNTLGEAQQRMAVQKDIQAVVRGGFAQPNPMVSPQIAREEIGQAIDIYAHTGPQVQQGLLGLMAAYDRTQQAPNQGQGGPQPKPQKPGQPQQGQPQGQGQMVQATSSQTAAGLPMQPTGGF
jgi:hypothetical protein